VASGGICVDEEDLDDGYQEKLVIPNRIRTFGRRIMVEKAVSAAAQHGKMRLPVWRMPKNVQVVV